MARDGNLGLMEAITGGRGRLLSHLSLLPGLKSTKTITLVITTTSPLSIIMETAREAFYYRLCRLPGLLRVEEEHVDHFSSPQHLSLVSRLFERWRGHKDSKWLVVVGEQG